MFGVAADFQTAGEDVVTATVFGGHTQGNQQIYQWLRMAAEVHRLLSFCIAFDERKTEVTRIVKHRAAAGNASGDVYVVPAAVGVINFFKHHLVFAAHHRIVALPKQGYVFVAVFQQVSFCCQVEVHIVGRMADDAHVWTCVVVGF